MPRRRKNRPYARVPKKSCKLLRDKSPWALFKPMAAALTDETFDRDRLSAALRQPGDAASDATLIAAIERLRETLDPDQRKKLAALVNQRFGGGFEL